ncbi:pantetheine-phosphate adenylyltransferase [Candidatus Bathyarchaeota archaeon]|jgi:pantetheine-phosphate adenylyltransferase|nr:pantetheine-phosphate adenylyltransferase [Candidatus Bathyarchaeota archaeon]
MPRKSRTVGVGGTFDELHKGHRALLVKAFEVGDHVVIGMSTDEFVRTMGKPHLTASYRQRLRDLKNFLGEHGLLQRVEIIPISDAYGGVLLSKGPIEALIVSRETEPTAVKINEKRQEIGLTPLQIIVIDMIPSENHSPISTTRIRRGEIDREGHLLKR